MNIFQRLHDFFMPSARNNYTPHVIGHRPLSFYAGLMVSLKLVTLFSVGLLPQSQAFSAAVTPENVLELTNYSRQAFGLQPLQMNTQLVQAAQAKAEDMLQNQYFAHVSPQGRTPWDFIKAAGYNYIIAGENLAINFYDSQTLENAWMSSPEHKANILNKDFDDIGIGVAQGEYKGVKAIFVVQMFGSSIDQPVVMQNNYTVPQQLADTQTQPGVFIPTPKQISLATPVLQNSDFTLTNQKEFLLKGFAPGADTVYVLVNHQPQQKAEVTGGQFQATLDLQEGSNVINVVSFDNQLDSSPISKPATIKLDSSAPVIAQTNLQPVNSNGNTYYLIEVQTQGDAAKILANLGDQNILLQPTNDPNIWQGKFIGSLADLQGRVNVTAFDLAGNSRLASVASFSGSIMDNYGFLASPDHKVNVFGNSLSLHSINEIYLYFVLFLLVALCVTIAVKKHIQHLGLIAHASALVIVALIFWIT